MLSGGISSYVNTFVNVTRFKVYGFSTVISEIDPLIEIYSNIEVSHSGFSLNP